MKPNHYFRRDFPIDATVDVLSLAGVDEAGRGALVGPVFAAAVVLGQKPIQGLTDSKLLSPKRRTDLFKKIQDHSLHWAIASSSAAEINASNILQASFLAMHRAVRRLVDQGANLSTIVVDGHLCPDLSPMLPHQVFCLVKGDQRMTAISAASILAKVARDNYLFSLHEQYPAYGFDQHKGYPTALHLSRLRQLGVMHEYRYHYKPVQQILQNSVAPCPHPVNLSMDTLW